VRVLVVEDDFGVASLLVDALTGEGYLIDAVSNGAEAIESLREYRPDAIVLDLMMPDMDGWDFLEQYRNVTGGDPIPIFVVSAAGAIAKSAHELGVRAFFRKPFDLAALLAAIREVA
jgi:DNA-binding response OmpR family regulator